MTATRRSLISRFLGGNIEEIGRDPALRIYGAAIALLHVLAFAHWEWMHPLTQHLDPRVGPAVCWPFFESCYDWRLLSPAGVQQFLWAYCLFAVATMALFSRRRLVPVAWWALLALSLVKSLILFQDYRLRLNQHYMTDWVTLAFLFVPSKRRAIPYLVASFYFWSGTLKLTPDWFSGAALHGRKPLGVPPALVPASCVYVVLLELVVVFGLLARRGWVFWSALAQFVAFHIASWPIVQFFYPTLMFAILTIFPLARYVADPAHPGASRPRAVDLPGFFRGREVRSVYGIVAAFALFQLVPFAFPGDRGLTGEGRLFALHMFDAPLECVVAATVEDGAGGRRTIALEVPLLPVRVRCDPIVYFSVARQLCARLAERDPSATLALTLNTRRLGEPHYHPVVEQPDFCRAGLHYDLWRSNAWIDSGR